MIKLRLIFAGLFSLLLISNGYTQTDASKEKSLKYFNKTEAGLFFGIGSFNGDVYNNVQKKIKNDELAFVLQTINGVKYANKLGLGISVGFEKWRNAILWPIYGFISYDFKNADNSFFADIALGYAIGTRYAQPPFTTFDGSGAFALTVGVAYKMKVANNLKFMYEVFYRYQSISTQRGYYMVDSLGTHLIRSEDCKVPLHFAGFKIGVIIP